MYLAMLAASANTQPSDTLLAAYVALGGSMLAIIATVSLGVYQVRKGSQVLREIDRLQRQASAIDEQLNRASEADQRERDRAHASAMIDKEAEVSRQGRRDEAKRAIVSDLKELQRHSLENWQVTQNCLREFRASGRVPHPMFLKKMHYPLAMKSTELATRYDLDDDLHTLANKLKEMMDNANIEIEEGYKSVDERRLDGFDAYLEFISRKFEMLFSVWTVFDREIFDMFEWRRHGPIEQRRLVYMTEKRFPQWKIDTLQPSDEPALEPKDIIFVNP